MCIMHNFERWKELKKWESLLYVWLCSMAEHIKLGSNPSSQYLLHLVCWFILYIFVNNTHTNVINRWMEYMEMRPRHYSQTKNSIWCDLGYDAPSGKEEKKLNKWWLWIFIWVIGNNYGPNMHYNLRYLWIQELEWSLQEFEIFYFICYAVDTAVTAKTKKKE